MCRYVNLLAGAASGISEESYTYTLKLKNKIVYFVGVYLAVSQLQSVSMRFLRSSLMVFDKIKFISFNCIRALFLQGVNFK